MSETADNDNKSSSLVRYENPAPGVARVVLDRVSRRNAQNTQLLYELDEMFLKAARDESIKVIILSGDGPDFSSGHDLREEEPTIPDRPAATLESSSAEPGIEGRHAYECEVYLGMCRRWRDIPKPTIAQVHGRAIAGALMLIWPMDLIIASESAQFSDPVVAFNLNGGEYFVHGWEVGPRRAKEMLFTGESLTAVDAYRLGMVNHVVSDSDLSEFTLNLAGRICQMPKYGLRLAKESVNGALRTQGQDASLDTAFGLHIAGHANNLHQHGELIDPQGVEVIRNLSKQVE